MNTFRGRAVAAALLAGVLAHAAGAYAQRSTAVTDGTPEIDASLAQQDWSGALAALDRRMASHPNDAQAEFKRATVLARMKRTDEAVAAFTALTQRYPELPEPYNNLAALYAQRGDYDDARQALETAVRANPGYALAYQNLGNLYLHLADAAFGRAIALDKRDAQSAQRRAQIAAIIAPASGAAAAHVAPGTTAQPPVRIEPASSFAPATTGQPLGTAITPNHLPPRY